MTLVLSRKAGERVFVGGPAMFFPVEVQSGKVRIGVQAASEHPVYRIEVIVDMLRSELKARSDIHKHGLDPATFEFNDPEAQAQTCVTPEMLEELRSTMEEERFLLIYTKLLLPDPDITYEDLDEFLTDPVMAEFFYRSPKVVIQIEEEEIS